MSAIAPLEERMQPAAEDLSGRRLRILFVTDDKFPPFRVDTAILVGEELASRGHKIDFLMQSSAPCSNAYRTTWLGNEVWVGKTDNGSSRISRVRKHIYWIFHQLRMFSMLKTGEYDLLQVKNKYIIALPAMLAARLYGVKFVYWLSYPFAEECLLKVKAGIARYPVYYWFKGHLLRLLAYRVIMPRALHVFVQSEQMKRDVVQEGVDASRLTPIPMGVSAASFEAYRTAVTPRPPLMSPEDRSIVYLGTIQRARRMDFMIQVLAAVLKEEPNCILYFVGDGEDAEDRRILEQLAGDLGIAEAVVFTGFLPREQAMDYVRFADVCVSPFYPTPILDSTSPTKLVEYMAMGKAVVANDHPEQKLVLAESGAGICVPYQTEAFALAILQLLMDPLKAQHMGRRGLEYVKLHRTYGKVATALEASYLQICAA